MGLFSRFIGRGRKPVEPDEREKSLIECSLAFAPKFTEAVRQLSLDASSTNRRAAQEALLEITLYLPEASPNGGKMTFQGLETPEGETAVAVFTDPFALEIWFGPPASTVLLPPPMFFQAAIDNRLECVMVNPAGPAGLRVEPAEYKGLSLGFSPWNIEKAYEVSVARPKADLAQPSKESIREALAGLPQVTTAYYVTLIVNNLQECPMVGVFAPEDLSGRDWSDAEQTAVESLASLPVMFTKIADEVEAKVWEDVGFKVF